MRERKEMVEKEEEVSVRHQCELLGVCRSMLYYTPSVETEENLEILCYMDTQYLKTPFYGECRLLSVLRREGYVVKKFSVIIHYQAQKYNYFPL